MRKKLSNLFFAGIILSTLFFCVRLAQAEEASGSCISESFCLNVSKCQMHKYTKLYIDGTVDCCGATVYNQQGFKCKLPE